MTRHDDPPPRECPGVWIAGLLAVLVAVCLPRAGAAQDHVVEVTPSVANGFFPGILMDGTAPDGTELEVGLEGALAGGLTIGVRPLEAVTVEVEGILIDDAQSSTAGTTLGPGISADLGTSYGYVGAAVRYRLPFRGERVRPFVVGGVGEKHFDAALVQSETGFTGSLGAGFLLEIPGWPDLRTELRDYVSSFEPGPTVDEVDVEGHVHHEVFWKVGAVFELF